VESGLTARIRAKSHKSAARPFIKWAGGKKGLLPELKRRVPPQYGRYFEPFLGGAALFFALSPSGAALSDANPYLVNAYRVVRDHVEELLVSLEAHRTDKEYYYRMRDVDPEGLSPIDRASWFIYLNKTCYNGLWRVNKAGRFNVPFGRYKNPRIADRKNLEAASAALRSASIDVSDFEDALSSARRGDFVYLDPPYHPVSRTANFTSYTGAGFGEPEQERLAAVFKDLSRRGVYVMLSNSDVPLVRSLYRGYNLDVVQAGRAISCKGEKRGPVNELIITSY
jgi:DNA adenine methylase